MDDARTLAVALVAELGEGWAIDRDYPTGTDHAAFTGPAGERLHLELAGWKGRLVINGGFSYPQRTTIKHSERNTYEITVAIETPPPKVADHIRRRLLPEYQAMLAETTDRVAQTVAAEVAQEELAGKLAAILPGGRLLNRDGRVVFDLPDSIATGDAQANFGGGSVRFELTLPTTYALRIAAHLRRLTERND